MSATDLIQRYLDIWNERDAAATGHDVVEFDNARIRDVVGFFA